MDSLVERFAIIIENAIKVVVFFLLVKVTDAVKIYNYLVGEGIIVRNRHTVSLCCNCLRVTVGTRVENDTLLAALKKYQE